MQPNPNQHKHEARSAADHLKAYNLFGFGESKDLPKARPDVLAPEYALKAVYPAILESAFSLTMDNFRVYIEEYNNATELENYDIHNHNYLVAKFLKSDQATDVHRAYAKHFPNLNKGLKDRDYNEAADKINEQHGPIIAKKVIQTVKYPTEQFFMNMLHIYNCQLMRRNEEYMRHAVTTVRPLQPLEINSYFVTQLQRDNGVKSLNVCHKTVRNHRMRLEEAGVLLDYVFQGRQKAVRVEINPQILVVLDVKNNALVTADFQPLNLWKGKNFPDNNEITGTYKEEYKEKDDAAQSSLRKESAEPTAFVYKSTFYRNTGRKEENQTEGAAAENVKIEKTLSEKLRDLILHPQELAENLAAKEYNAYSPIDIRYLEREAVGGTLTNAEFKELFIQDFFKQAAKLYRETTPFAGNWKKAINLWMKEMFITYNGHPLGKEAIAKRIPELRWRLENARKWFVRAKIRPLYPYDYFDPTRNTSREIGFAYTAKMWKNKLKSDEREPALKLKREQNAEKRKKTINHSKKLETAVNRFLKERITLPQLEDYVRENLPPEYSRELPAFLKRKMADPAPVRKR